MPVTLTSLADLAALPFDDILDVRSPAEYAEDRVPGAISLPALSNDERARVGTIYVQQDRFLARKIGAALVARNVASHLEGALADRDGGWRPLVYCWRGGQRSGSVAVILKQIGWRAETVEGGYRAYRRLVATALHDAPFPARVILIDGNTGTAKTRLLTHLAEQGAQVIDLEGLAAHRGSLFGPLSYPQPSQKAFESDLAGQAAVLDPARPVFIEAESTRIGRINLPPSLVKAMQQAGAVRITAPMAARVAHLLDSYGDLTADPAALDAVLGQLVRYQGHKRVERWRALAAAGDFATLAAELMEHHYDPRYLRMSRPEARRDLDLPDLSDATLAQAAATLAAEAERL